MRIFLSFLTLVMIFLAFAGSAVCEDKSITYQIMFSKFDSKNAGNLAYLSESIEGMLISRLATKERIEVVDHTLTTKELRQLKQKRDFSTLKSQGLDVSYIVTGRMLAVAGGMNIQVVLYPTDTTKEILNFSVLSESTDSLISDIGDLADRIAGDGFGYTAGSKAAASTDTESGLGGFTTVHPEAAYKKGLYTGTVVGSEIAGFHANAIGVKRKLSIAGEITALAVADADNDGKSEIITLQGNRINIYRMEGRKILEVDTTSLPAKLRVHALNVADINGDGIQEIYLSATQGIYISSLIMAWSEKSGFSSIAQNIALYLRPVNIPKQGVRLAGQRRGVEKLDLVRPGIRLYELGEKNELIKGKILPLPESVNLFDFTFADLDGDGYHEKIVIDEQENLQVYSPSNELLWVSSKKFGGSKMYLGPSQGSSVNEVDNINFSVDEDADRDLIFVPGRVSVADINQDGKDEIIVTESSMSMMGFFKRMRPYTAGMVVGLVWSNDELVEAWRTGRYRGYLVDYSFSLKQVQENEKGVSGLLYVANIPQSGSLLSMLPGSGDTELSVYDLGFSEVKQTDK